MMNPLDFQIGNTHCNDFYGRALNYKMHLMPAYELWTKNRNPYSDAKLHVHRDKSAVTICHFKVNGLPILIESYRTGIITEIIHSEASNAVQIIFIILV